MQKQAKTVSTYSVTVEWGCRVARLSRSI